MIEHINTKEEVIVLKGNLTSENVSEVQENFEWALNHTSKLTIDLTHLHKLDVVGVFMLLILKKNAKTVGKKILILNHGNKIITQSVKISGMQNIIDVA